MNEENKMVIDALWPGEKPPVVDDVYVTCPICGQEVSEDIVCYSVCDYCMEKHETYENALKYGADRPEPVEINGFLAYEFTPEQINEILTKELNIARQLGADPNFGAYIEDDQSDFESWLIEQTSK